MSSKSYDLRILKQLNGKTGNLTKNKMERLKCLYIITKGHHAKKKKQNIPHILI
jgi:hypothetical protein